MKDQLIERNEDEFHTHDGRKISREYGECPNGNNINGRWVLRSADGEFIDKDGYREDLAERHNLRFQYDDIERMRY